MLQTLKLLIPALIPSWRFFDIIAPSPRIEFALLKGESGMPGEWQAFRPHPDHLPFLSMLGRLLWNPQWNESMYMVSCAEYLMESPTPHREEQIMTRIMNDVLSEHPNRLSLVATHLQFRLLVIERNNTERQETMMYYSRVVPLAVQQ